MSIDGRIGRVIEHDDGLLLEIMPRGMPPDAGYQWSVTGQDRLTIERPYSYRPEPGQIIWGGSETVTIGKEPDNRRYQRIGAGRLRER